VPCAAFPTLQEYLDVFEPLVLEECCAQVLRGGEARARLTAPQSRRSRHAVRALR
jgi:hypothetical protein